LKVTEYSMESFTLLLVATTKDIAAVYFGFLRATRESGLLMEVSKQNSI
jgi:hypothetical protein